MVNNKPAASVRSSCRLRSRSGKRCSLAAGTACCLASYADDDVEAVRTEGKNTRRATEQSMKQFKGRRAVRPRFFRILYSSTQLFIGERCHLIRATCTLLSLNNFSLHGKWYLWVEHALVKRVDDFPVASHSDSRSISRGLRDGSSGCE